MKGRGKSFFEKVGVIKLCLRFTVLEFSPFLGVILKIFIFQGELRYGTKTIKNRVAGDCSKSLFL